MSTEDAAWMAYARKLLALAQNGLAYVVNEFDRDRYQQVQAVAVDMLAGTAGALREPLLASLGQEQGYMTPKVDVRGALFRDGKILMVREHVDGCWSLPGGWADVNDTPSAAVEREIREESGVNAKVHKVVGVWDRRLHGHPVPVFHAYKLFFACQDLGGEPRADGVEILDVGFFGLEALPPLSEGRVTRWQVERLFLHHQHPELPTEFD